MKKIITVWNKLKSISDECIGELVVKHLLECTAARDSRFSVALS